MAKGLGLSGGWVSDTELEIHLSGKKFEFVSFGWSEKDGSNVLVLKKKERGKDANPESSSASQG